LIERYPGHEALWCHRRFLLAFLLNQVLSPSSIAAHFFSPLPCIECPATLGDEVGFAKDCELDVSVERFEEQRQHALTFQLWLLVLVRETTRRLPEIVTNVHAAGVVAGDPLDQTDTVRKLAATVDSPALYILGLTQGWPPTGAAVSKQ